MKNKLSLTIGIPAYNEAKNIKSLVISVLKQKQRRFNLEKIIIYSDASTDNTLGEVKSLKNNNVQILEGTRRRGKSYALNQIIDNTHSDIFVQVDADILIREKELIENLIDPIINSKADLTSARVKEYHPKNRLQIILKISMYLKKDIFERINNGNNIYTCHGRARAMSKKLYKSIYFKPTIVAEDAYAYLYTVSKKYKYTKYTCYHLDRT